MCAHLNYYLLFECVTCDSTSTNGKLHQERCGCTKRYDYLYGKPVYAVAHPGMQQCSDTCRVTYCTRCTCIELFYNSKPPGGDALWIKRLLTWAFYLLKQKCSTYWSLPGLEIIVYTCVLIFWNGVYYTCRLCIAPLFTDKTFMVHKSAGMYMLIMYSPPGYEVLIVRITGIPLRKGNLRVVQQPYGWRYKLSKTHIHVVCV